MSANESLEELTAEIQEQTLTSYYVPRVAYDDGTDDSLELQLHFKLIELCDRRHCGHA